MHTVDLYRWRLVDSWTGKTYITRCRMSEADALDLDPHAQRIEGSLERRTVPDGPHEHADTNSGN